MPVARARPTIQERFVDLLSRCRVTLGRQQVNKVETPTGGSPWGLYRLLGQRFRVKLIHSSEAGVKFCCHKVARLILVPRLNRIFNEEFGVDLKVGSTSVLSTDVDIMDRIGGHNRLVRTQGRIEEEDERLPPGSNMPIPG